jgi:hypothetical protein
MRELLVIDRASTATTVFGEAYAGNAIPGFWSL